MDDAELINRARGVLNPRQWTDYADAGGVGSALVTDKENVYVGVNIDACCGIGYCAEHNAIGTMITHKESRIVTIVAVNKEGTPLSPCGRCREFIYQINEENVDTRVLLDGGRVVTLKDLLPEHWGINRPKD